MENTVCVTAIIIIIIIIIIIKEKQKQQCIVSKSIPYLLKVISTKTPSNSFVTWTATGTF